MTKRQQDIVRRFVQVQRFLEDHPGALPPEGEVLCERLDAVIAAVAVPPDHARHDGRRSKTVVEARYELYEQHLAPLVAAAQSGLPVAQAARFVCADITTPVPDMITGAKVMADRAVAHRDALVEAGLDPDFVERLQGAIESLEGALRSGQRSLDRGRHSPTVIAARNIEQGSRVVRLLDMLVRPMLVHDRPLLLQWDAAKRSARDVGSAVRAPGESECA